MSGSVGMWAAILIGFTIVQAQTRVSAFVPLSFGCKYSTLLQEKKKKGEFTVRDLIDEMQRNPAAFQPDGTKQGTYKRTRKRVDTPKQQYLYASQRETLEKQGKLPKKKDEAEEEVKKAPVVDKFSPLYQARQFGLVNAAAQHSDAAIDDIQPKIVGQIRVGDELATSGSMAYIINKPAGWSILGGGTKKKGSSVNSEDNDNEESDEAPAIDESEGGNDGNDVVEYDDSDILALLTPEERSQYGDEITSNSLSTGVKKNKKGSRVKRVKVMDEDGSLDILEYDEADILSVMTPEEIAEFKEEGGFVAMSDPKVTENIRKIQERASGGEIASFASPSRPSVVAWLKEIKAAEGTPIRGGNYWTAVAGATNVDDTGLVVICPKTNVKNVFVEYAKYVVVVGNGKYIAPKGKTKDAEIPKESCTMDVIAKLRRGRLEDTVLAVSVTLLESLSSCNSVVQLCQDQFLDGIRGDPTANPLDRRASRRLIHCDALSVSSLAHDDNAVVQTESLPDDISILADRRNHHEFVKGTFLGRASLKANPHTNAYREINGVGDGFQGWTVDRYDKWLLVQHDDKCYKGPLPSIHDGNTAGVYYLPANPNRSAMGSRDEVRPTLLEGKPAPDVLPILENGVTYHVSLDKDLSTGIFLDQRLQRAWLTKNCNEKTKVLNCFAHCGAFSVAAASAGASTVSLDLNKKWLDRVEPQMLANGIDFSKHDCIYGDCFDWLSRLAKRGEKYDIVILDPPSSSVGKTKKRWSIKSDMDSLVALAAPLVKKGGLLLTTTNSASVHPTKFARMCQKGLEEAGVGSAKLERLVPMPVDFPSIGPQAVKNLVWRMP